jgi:hypothetical protein
MGRVPFAMLIILSLFGLRTSANSTESSDIIFREADLITLNLDVFMAN